MCSKSSKEIFFSMFYPSDICGVYEKGLIQPDIPETDVWILPKSKESKSIELFSVEKAEE